MINFRVIHDVRIIPTHFSITLKMSNCTHSSTPTILHSVIRLIPYTHRFSQIRINFKIHHLMPIHATFYLISFQSRLRRTIHKKQHRRDALFPKHLELRRRPFFYLIKHPTTYIIRSPINETILLLFYFSIISPLNFHSHFLSRWIEHKIRSFFRTLRHTHTLNALLLTKLTEVTLSLFGTLRINHIDILFGNVLRKLYSSQIRRAQITGSVFV